jgi:hypothetical protein
VANQILPIIGGAGDAGAEGRREAKSQPESHANQGLEMSFQAWGFCNGKPVLSELKSGRAASPALTKRASGG